MSGYWGELQYYGDEVRLRVREWGQTDPDHIATYRVCHETPTRNAGPGRDGADQRQPVPAA